MTTPSADKVLKTLRDLKSELQAKYSVKEIGLFGSVLRGEQTKASDIDILVEFSRPIGFFKFLELEEYLETVLGAKVYLVSKKALKPHIGILTILSILIGAVVAMCLHPMRQRQIKGQSNLELGRKLLTVTYQVRNIIETLRNFPQLTTQYKELEDNPNWRQLEKAQSEFRATAVEAEALWGNEVKQRTEPISSSVQTIKWAIRLNLRDAGQEPVDASTKNL